MHYDNDPIDTILDLGTDGTALEAALDARLVWSFEPSPGEPYAFDGDPGDEVWGGQCDDCGGSHYRIEATHTVLCHTCGRHIPIRQRRAADCIW